MDAAAGGKTPGGARRRTTERAEGERARSGSSSSSGSESPPVRERVIEKPIPAQHVREFNSWLNAIISDGEATNNMTYKELHDKIAEAIGFKVTIPLQPNEENTTVISSCWDNLKRKYKEFKEFKETDDLISEVDRKAMAAGLYTATLLSIYRIRNKESDLDTFDKLLSSY